MPTLPQLTILKRHYERMQSDVAARTRQFAAKLGHQRAKSLANTLVIALLFLVLPSHQAYALPLLVPLLWAGGAAIGAWIGSKAIEAIGDALMSALVGIAWLLFTIAGYFMMAMAGILDLAIQFTINSEIYRSVSAIQVGWTAVRDLANMFFIFVLLFIAIQTILGMGGSNAKRWVAHLVIAALLINFSLFFTQVVVDAGNILAVGFWNKMKVQAGPNASSSAAAFFIEGFRMQTNFDTIKTAASREKIEIGKVQKIEIYLGGMFVQFVAGYVFLAGAIMMIIRSVTLMVLMIASPFAFLGFALPKGGGFASRWLDKLIGATFLAPAFIFMLYIDSLIIRGTEVLRVTGADQDKFALAFIGSVNNFAVIYNFLLMIILLLASLKVASEVGSGVGASAGGFAKKAIGVGGGLALAGFAATSRQTIGRGANALRQSEKVQQYAQRNDLRGSMARMALRTSNAAAKSSLDVRATPLAGLARASGVNLGSASTAGGFTGARVKADKEAVERAKELFPNNPKAQEAYLMNAGRIIPGVGTSRYEKKPGEFARKEDKVFKDAKKEIEAEKSKLEAEKSIKNTFKDFEEGAGGIGKEMGEGMKKELEGYFAKIGPKAALEAFPVKDIVKNIQDGKVDRRIDALTPQILSEMAKDMDKHQENINLLAPKLLAEGSDDQRRYVINQSKNNPAFASVDLSKELVDRAKRYKDLSATAEPTDAEAKKKHYLTLAAHKSAMRDLVGGISPEELARMDNDAVKFDPVIAENYTKAHYEEIGRYHMNDAKDAGTKRAQFDRLREASGRANQGVKDYMKKAVADVNSAYYDPSGDFKARADAEKKVRDTADRLSSAEREYAAFKSDPNENFKAGKGSTLEKKVEEARSEHETAKKTRDGLSSKKNEEPEAEDEDDGETPPSAPVRPSPPAPSRPASSAPVQRTQPQQQQQQSRAASVSPSMSMPGPTVPPVSSESPTPKYSNPELERIDRAQRAAEARRSATPTAASATGGTDAQRAVAERQEEARKRAEADKQANQQLADNMAKMSAESKARFDEVVGGKTPDQIYRTAKEKNMQPHEVTELLRKNATDDQLVGLSRDGYTQEYMDGALHERARAHVSREALKAAAHSGTSAEYTKLYGRSADASTSDFQQFIAGKIARGETNWR